MIKELSRRLPSFRSDYSDLPHVAFGEVVALLQHTAASGEETEYMRLLSTILDFVEEAAGSSDPRLADLVKVSFLENLNSLGHRCQEVVRDLCPMTAKLLEEYESVWGSVCSRKQA